MRGLRYRTCRWMSDGNCHDKIGFSAGRPRSLQIVEQFQPAAHFRTVPQAALRLDETGSFEPYLFGIEVTIEDHGQPSRHVGRVGRIVADVVEQGSQPAAGVPSLSAGSNCSSASKRGRAIEEALEAGRNRPARRDPRTPTARAVTAACANSTALISPATRRVRPGRDRGRTRDH